MECPQCRSTNVSHDGVFEYATCDYCNNEFYPVSLSQLRTAIQQSTAVVLPQYKNPLQIQEIQGSDSNIIIYLAGKNGGEYKLLLTAEHTGSLKRRKSGSERNQFGSRWTNGTSTWPEGLQ